MKTAIIGIGPHGKRLIEVVERINELDLVGIVDKNLDVLNSFERLSENKKFTSTAELYDSIKIDVLLIATNADSHSALTLEAIEKGVKYIMVEKPMACSVAECQKMEFAAHTHGVRLSVDKKNRHDPVIQFFKNKLNSGDWGSLRNIYLQIPGIGLGCLATHWTDIATYLVGDFPIKITGWVDTPKKDNPRGKQFVDPGGLIIMDYGNEMKAIVTQIEDGAGPLTMEIHTTNARVIFDPKNNFIDMRERDMTVIPKPGIPAVYNKLIVPENLNVKGDMLQQIESVVRELISENSSITDSKYGTSAVEIIAATYISHKLGNIPINLPLTDKEYLNLYLPIT